MEAAFEDAEADAGIADSETAAAEPSGESSGSKESAPRLTASVMSCMQLYMSIRSARPAAGKRSTACKTHLDLKSVMFTACCCACNNASTRSSCFLPISIRMPYLSTASLLSVCLSCSDSPEDLTIAREDCGGGEIARARCGLDEPAHDARACEPDGER